MKKFLFLFILLFSLKSYAQRHYLGYHGALGASNRTDTLLNTGDNRKPSFNFGMTYGNAISNRFRLGADLLYQQQGYSTKFNIIDRYGNILETYKIRNRHNYLTLPVKGSLVFGYKTKLLLNLGVAPSVLLYAVRRYITTPVRDYTDPNFERKSTTEYVKRFELAGLLEIELEQRIAEELYLCPSFSFRHSINKFDKSTLVGYDSKYWQSGFYFGLTIKQRFIKK